MSTLTIGQVAKQTGVTVEAIRYYEKESLLAKPQRTTTGYRVYDPEVIRRIRFINRAKEVGFSLKEISELLSLQTSSTTSCANVRHVAMEKITDIEEKIADLNRMHDALKTLADRCDGVSEVSECPILDALEHNGHE